MQVVKQTDIQVNKLMSLVQLKAVTGLSRSTIYELINPKSRYYDPTFPKQINLTMNRVAWIEREINDWIELKIAKR